jgi:hypothetical protein
MGEGGYRSTFLDLSTSWRWLVSFTPQSLYPWGKSLWYPMDGPQSQCGCRGVEKNLLSLLGNKLWPSSPQPIAIPTEVSAPSDIWKWSKLWISPYPQVWHLSIRMCKDDRLLFTIAEEQEASELCTVSKIKETNSYEQLKYTKSILHNDLKIFKNLLHKMHIYFF